MCVCVCDDDDDGVYRVIDGWETLDDLEKVPVHDKTFRPTTDIRLRRITIHANPLA